MTIGAQLYTVRDFCQNTEDFSETLKKIAEIGYKYVQVSGVCEYSPEWLKKELDKNGLECVLTHIPPERIAKETNAVISEHNVLGCRNVGIGWYEVHKEGVQAFYDRFYTAGKALSQNGMRLCYHNHDQEFMKIDGKTVLKLLDEKFPTDVLSFTPDTYWIQMGGADPAECIAFLKDRVPCVHLKDMEYGRKMAALGEGNLNFDRIIAACDDAGTKYMLVEQDNCYGKSPFECLKISFDFLRSRGF